MKSRRSFLRALGLAPVAVVAATALPQPPQVIEKITTVLKEVWPSFLPPLVSRDTETMIEEDLRLLRYLVDAPRQVLVLTADQDVIWNGLGFRLVRGTNAVPAPIAEVYLQSQADMARSAKDLWADLKMKYPARQVINHLGETTTHPLDIDIAWHAPQGTHPYGRVDRWLKDETNGHS